MVSKYLFVYQTLNPDHHGYDTALVKLQEIELSGFVLLHRVQLQWRLVLKMQGSVGRRDVAKSGFVATHAEL